MTGKELLEAYAKGERDFAGANLARAYLTRADLTHAKLGHHPRHTRRD